jgi:hypothetical protein
MAVRETIAADKPEYVAIATRWLDAGGRHHVAHRTAARGRGSSRTSFRRILFFKGLAKLYCDAFVRQAAGLAA